jgi:hypothetical protein
VTSVPDAHPDAAQTAADLDDRQRRGLRITLFIAACVLILTMPALLYPGDAGMMRLTSRELLTSGKITVSEPTVLQYGVRGQYFFENPRDGQWYSKYGIANTVLYAIPLGAERLMTGEIVDENTTTPKRRLVRVAFLNAFNIALALLTIAWAYRLATKLTDSSRAAATSTLFAVFGSYVWFYLRAQTVEVMQIATFTGLCFYLDARHRAPSTASQIRSTVAAMFCCGLLILGKLVYAPLLLIAAVCLSVERNEVGSGLQLIPRSGQQRTICVLAILLAAGIGALVLGTNWWRFGSPFTTGYTQWELEKDPFRNSPLEAVLGFIRDPRASVFVHCPWLLPGLLGIPFAIRRIGICLTFAWLAFLAEVLVVGSFDNWRGEWCYGPRYLVFAMPVLSLPMAALYEHLRKFRPAVARAARLAAILGFLVMARYQWAINRIPYFAAHHAEGVCADYDPQTKIWFAQRPVWSVDLALLNIDRKESAFPPLETFPAPEPRATIKRQLKRYAAPNLYWLHALTQATQ